MALGTGPHFFDMLTRYTNVERTQCLWNKCSHLGLLNTEKVSHDTNELTKALLFFLSMASEAKEMLSLLFAFSRTSTTTESEKNPQVCPCVMQKTFPF